METSRPFINRRIILAFLSLGVVVGISVFLLWLAQRAKSPQEPLTRRATISARGDSKASQPPAKIDFPLAIDPASRAPISPSAAASMNAALPLSGAPNPPAAPFVLRTTGGDRERALQCLTQAIYYEAGFEPAAGEEAVAQVVLNRLRHPIFPKTICGVVFQGSNLKTGCQFSFTCDGSLSHTPQRAAWARARSVAEQAASGFVLDSVGQATHYHTQWVVPWWRSTVSKVTQIGAHIFYRWPGSLGMPPAFNGHYLGYEPVNASVTSIQTSASAISSTNLTAQGEEQKARTASLADMPMISPRQRLLALSAHGLLGNKPAFDTHVPSDAALATPATPHP